MDTRLLLSVSLSILCLVLFGTVSSSFTFSCYIEDINTENVDLTSFSTSSNSLNVFNSNTIEEVRFGDQRFLSSGSANPKTYVTVKVIVDQYLREIYPFNGADYKGAVRRFTQGCLDTFDESFGIVFSVEVVTDFTNTKDAITQNGEPIQYVVGYSSGSPILWEAYDNLAASFGQAMNQTGWNYNFPTNDYDLLIVLVRHREGGHNCTSGCYNWKEHDSSEEGNCPNACIVAFEAQVEPLFGWIRVDNYVDILPPVLIVHEVGHLWGALHQAHRKSSPIFDIYRGGAEFLGYDPDTISDCAVPHGVLLLMKIHRKLWMIGSTMSYTLKVSEMIGVTFLEVEKMTILPVPIWVLVDPTVTQFQI